ncbi:MAG: type II toxin-antitoxin system VapC family toxin [Chloroflexi bacterium]|nr:type II toxin-antitoxin system VapC family toxin [Chloroflexota bacterium]
MPATELAFSNPPPRALYLDTDVLINYLVSSEPHHQRSRTFLERLLAQDTTLYVSSLTWIEYAHVITRDDFRRRLSQEIRQRLRLDRWGDRAVRQRYLQEYVQALDELLAQFEWAEVFPLVDVRQAALGFMDQYNLDGQDAIHLASAFSHGVVDFASFDRVYRRVDGLHLWNDLIYAGQSA